jgi:hypothetical protein
LPGERDFHSAKGLRSTVRSAAFGDAFARAAIVVCMELHVDDATLTVALTPAERLLSMHPAAELRIPRASIKAARIDKDPARPLAVRFGTDLPFMVLAGWLWRPGAKEFWLHRRSREALCLELEGSPMVRVVVDAPPEGHPARALVA